MCTWVLSQSNCCSGGATPTMDESEPVVASTGNIAIVEVNSGVPITKTRVETSSSSSSSSSSSDSSDSSSDDDRRRKPKMRPSRSMMDKMDRRRYQRFFFAWPLTHVYWYSETLGTEALHPPLVIHQSTSPIIAHQKQSQKSLVQVQAHQGKNCKIFKLEIYFYSIRVQNDVLT